MGFVWSVAIYRLVQGAFADMTSKSCRPAHLQQQQMFSRLMHGTPVHCNAMCGVQVYSSS